MFGIAYISRLFSSSNDAVDNVIGGSDAVFNAILENTDGGMRYEVRLGDPELVDRGGNYSTEYMVRIPTSTGVGDPDPPNIEYELPDGDSGESELFDLLDLYNIEQVSDLGDLENQSVMASFEDGTLTFQFNELEVAE